MLETEASVLFSDTEVPSYRHKMLDSSIRHVLVRHEQYSRLMADGYSRASGKTGSASPQAAGTTNLVTASEPFADSVP